jgi:hypothetical protein
MQVRQDEVDATKTGAAKKESDHRGNHTGREPPRTWQSPVQAATKAGAIMTPPPRNQASHPGRTLHLLRQEDAGRAERGQTPGEAGRQQRLQYRIKRMRTTPQSMLRPGRDGHGSGAATVLPIEDSYQSNPLTHLQSALQMG